MALDVVTISPRCAGPARAPRKGRDNIPSSRALYGRGFTLEGPAEKRTRVTPFHAAPGNSLNGNRAGKSNCSPFPWRTRPEHSYDSAAISIFRRFPDETREPDAKATVGLTHFGTLISRALRRRARFCERLPIGLGEPSDLELGMSQSLARR